MFFRAALAYVLIALVGISLAAGASAQQAERESITVTIYKGAWYSQAPACATPIDCALLPAPNPYPEDTLHVALSGGEETARTYLALSFILPVDAELTGGTLELPVDTDPLHGSVTPEAAKMVACLATKKFKEARGSLEKPPATKCAMRKGATYDAEGAVFTVDLDRFVEEWDGGIAALALRPSQSALEGTDSWHVTFPAAKQASEGQPVIAATLTYLVDEATGGLESGGSDPGPALSGSGPTDISSIAGPSLGGFAAPQSQAPTTQAPTTPAPADATSTQPVAVTTVPLSGFAGEGFAYPIVWAFPLLLLVLYGLIGRALTKEL